MEDHHNDVQHLDEETLSSTKEAYYCDMNLSEVLSEFNGVVGSEEGRHHHHNLVDIGSRDHTLQGTKKEDGIGDLIQI